MQTFFITGTDTDCGKTYISTLLLRFFNQKGLQTSAMKPIASGGFEDKYGRWINEDLAYLSNEASCKLDLNVMNPFSFRPAIAPHIAAKLINRSLTHNQIVEKIALFLNYQADIAIIEGAGGWLLPLNDQASMADVISTLALPVILVIGMKVGCLNHALLTANSIKQSNCRLAGFITNEPSGRMDYLSENIQTLKKMLDVPHLAHVNLGDQQINLDLNQMIHLSAVTV